MGLSIWHLLVVVLVVVLLFGTKRLPNVMEDLAKGIKSFKKGLKDEDIKTLPQDKKDDQKAGE
jgi:sec-independent protein translocase protein TatA